MSFFCFIFILFWVFNFFLFWFFLFYLFLSIMLWYNNNNNEDSSLTIIHPCIYTYYVSRREAYAYSIHIGTIYVNTAQHSKCRKKVCWYRRYKHTKKPTYIYMYIQLRNFIYSKKCLAGRVPFRQDRLGT